MHPDDADYLLSGCDVCGSKFFFYVPESRARDADKSIAMLSKSEMKEIEGDVRDILKKNELDTTGDKTVILLPSKKKKIISSKCRAMIGVVAGSGRLEKPFKKAGAKYYKMRAFGKVYPRTSGVSMNAVDHPFGGKTKPGKHITVSRHMPPGKKVGSISPKRTGKRK